MESLEHGVVRRNLKGENMGSAERSWRRERSLKVAVIATFWRIEPISIYRWHGGGFWRSLSLQRMLRPPALKLREKLWWIASKKGQTQRKSSLLCHGWLRMHQDSVEAQLWKQESKKDRWVRSLTECGEELEAGQLIFGCNLLSPYTATLHSQRRELSTTVTFWFNSDLIAN